MTPSRAVQIMGKGHGQQDPLPRWAFAVIFGLLALWLLGDLVAAQWNWQVDLFGYPLDLVKVLQQSLEQTGKGKRAAKHPPRHKKAA